MPRDCWCPMADDLRAANRCIAPRDGVDGSACLKVSLFTAMRKRPLPGVSFLACIADAMLVDAENGFLLVAPRVTVAMLVEAAYGFLLVAPRTEAGTGARERTTRRGATVTLGDVPVACRTADRACP